MNPCTYPDPREIDGRYEAFAICGKPVTGGDPATARCNSCTAQAAKISVEVDARIAASGGPRAQALRARKFAEDYDKSDAERYGCDGNNSGSW